MTTIKDYLRDILKEGEKLQQEYVESTMTVIELEDREEEILDKYTEIIAKRIVGQD